MDLPRRGLTRRLRRGRRACSPMGRSIASGGDPKGSGREAGIQWIQPPKAVSDPEFRQTTSGTHGSAGCADCLPRGKPPTRPLAHTPVLCGYADSPKGVQGGERKAPLLAALCNNFAVSNSPLAGPDAPTPARIGTGRPMGRSHFSFGGERKVCKRKPAARRLREKALDCPFWRRGSQCRAQWSWIAFTNCWSALVLAFFRRQSGRAFFPPLPIAALLRRRLGGGRGRIARVGKFRQDLADLAALISNEEI